MKTISNDGLVISNLEVSVDQTVVEDELKTVNAGLTGVNSAISNNTSTLSTKIDTTNTSLSTINTSMSTNTTTLESKLDELLARIDYSIKPTLGGIGLKHADSRGLGIVSNGYRYTAIEVLGYTSTCFLNAYKACVPLLGANQFTYLPPSAMALQMTSSSVNDAFTGGTAAKTVVVFGYNATWDFVTDAFLMNGQNRVTGMGGVQFIRVLGFQVVDSANQNVDGISAGNLFLTPATYASFTAGTPNDLTQCLAVAEVGHGVGYTGSVCIKPGDQVYFSELVISTDTNANSVDVRVAFFAKTGTSGFKRLSNLYTNSASATVYLSQSGFPGAAVDTTNGTLPTDVYVAVQRSSGNTNTIGVSLFLTGMDVAPA